ncbi:hypothetical protein [Mesorhizobium australicum]|uniref:Uncharacterized protein n=1 Tax=Mesorhizobium australicum TaxID=536018 RepID=A0A1X7PI45_9HYPH|nr:hypothetical protein [Mesorhizobium australicum]SMH51139.1 hypothetical protein SAMN02982922_4333 [Mesorhizobium australicum]
MNQEQLHERIKKIRDEYVERELEPAIARLSAKSPNPNRPEVKFGEIDGVYKGLAAVDWAESGPEFHATVVAGYVRVSFPPMTADYRQMSLEIAPFHWDSLSIEFEKDTVGQSRFEQWFDRWFDIDDERVSDGGVSGIIHSAIVEPKRISLDMGSAPSDALFELLDVLRESGVKQARLGPSE